MLRPRGRGFLVANTAEFYAHRWVSCDVDFPENQGPLRSGQTVKVRLQPEGVVVTDTFWCDADYQAAIRSAGLQAFRAGRPLAPETNPLGAWLDETRVAPWVIYEVERPTSAAHDDQGQTTRNPQGQVENGVAKPELGKSEAGTVGCPLGEFPDHDGGAN